MSSGVIVVIIVVAIIVVASAAALAMAGRRRQLQRQFGPEYDVLVKQENSQMRAEAELTQRQRRVRKLNIQPLPEAARRRYVDEWQAIQEEFVDSPQSALTEAYSLVTSVMQERGYPTDDDEQVTADLSVDHARTVGNFRAAQAVTRDVAHGSVETEDMRQALIQYRELFTDLLGQPLDGEPVNGVGARHAKADETEGYERPDPAITDPDGAATTYQDTDV
jgi:hypothetical protein